MDLVVFCHLRWNFVYQRPQQLLGRCARENRVFFFEEPLTQDGVVPQLRESTSNEGVTVLVPELPSQMDEPQETVLNWLVQDYLREHDVTSPVLWYYTPMAIEFTQSLPAALVVYDCMDELSAFRGAPPGLQAAEAALMNRADLVFTGGKTLHESKSKLHSNVHLFPSSIDFEHFRRARTLQTEPADQEALPRPRLGYCGVIDERMDLDLLAGVAALHPSWQIIILGPVVKIDATELPTGPNLHYLGLKEYKDLPAYLSGWDIAMLPFARNESTRYISPTKTPEYLAAGLPTISTSIRDVVSPYGDSGLVMIADDAPSFIEAAERLLGRSSSEEQRWLSQVDNFLAANSWDRTWSSMWELIQETSRQRAELAASAD